MANEQQESELIRRVLNESKKVLSISEIRKQTGLAIGNRTLIRRLTKLVDDGIIERIGEKRGTAYQAIVKEKETDQHAEPTLIPLTLESKEILTLVNRPQISRTPVGYDRVFLERY